MHREERGAGEGSPGVGARAVQVTTGGATCAAKQPPEEREQQQGDGRVQQNARHVVAERPIPPQPVIRRIGKIYDGPEGHVRERPAGIGGARNRRIARDREEVVVNEWVVERVQIDAEGHRDEDEAGDERSA